MFNLLFICLLKLQCNMYYGLIQCYSLYNLVKYGTMRNYEQFVKVKVIYYCESKLECYSSYGRILHEIPT